MRAGSDVIVIGGGIVGVACAAHLAERGFRVTLLERERLAAGASGRNSGVVQHPFDPALTTLYEASAELYRAVASNGIGGFDLPDEPAGLLYVTHDEAGAARLTEAWASAHPGLDATLISPGMLATLEPALVPGLAACRLRMGYPVAPASATRAYAARAADLGVVIHEGTSASPWMVDDRVRGVILADGRRLPAGDVVVAAGPWTPGLIDPTGAWRPIRPVWGVVVGAEVEQPMHHVVEEAEMDAERMAGGSTEVSFTMMTAAGSTSIGSTFLEDERPAEAGDPVDVDGYADAILERATRFVPALARARVVGTRLCARPQSADGRPMIGRVPWADGLWVVAGHGPWGISTGPASGRLLADLLAGAVTAPPVPFDPGRFGAP